GVPAFIVTLAGMLVFRGVLIGLTRGQTIAPLNESFKAIGTSYIPYIPGYIFAVICIILLYYVTTKQRKRRKELGLTVQKGYIDYGKVTVYSILILLIVYMLNRYFGIPIPSMIVVFIGAIVAFIASNTSFGRYLYAIGGNSEAA